jgi:hypothetical protein
VKKALAAKEAEHTKALQDALAAKEAEHTKALQDTLAAKEAEHTKALLETRIEKDSQHSAAVALVSKQIQHLEAECKTQSEMAEALRSKLYGKELDLMQVKNELAAR